MQGDFLLAIGTVKGLFRFRSADRRRWEPLPPTLRGTAVNTTAYQPASGVLFAAANSVFYGAAVRRSADLGETWDTGGEGLQYGADDEERVTAVWSLRVGSEAEPNLVYAGVEASGLFRSEDGGGSWSEVAALRRHPTHAAWGAGFGGKCLHTIAVDPHARETLYVAASTGGIYRSRDRGETFEPINRGIAADFLPEDERYPVAGQCVHKFAPAPTREGRLWLQNHGGVYRSDNHGDDWTHVSAALPADFGFPVVAHPHRADTAFVAPLTATLERWFPDERPTVQRTDDGGATWRALRSGLPDRSYGGVLRDGFRADTETPVGLYLGTTNGEVYWSADEGESWRCVVERLPRILSVEVFRM